MDYNITDTIEAKPITRYWGAPETRVIGQPSDENGREIIVTIPWFDRPISDPTKERKGQINWNGNEEEFNGGYNAYGSDKTIMDFVFKKNNLVVDLSNMPDNVLNPEN